MTPADVHEAIKFPAKRVQQGSVRVYMCEHESVCMCKCERDRECGAVNRKAVQEKKEKQRKGVKERAVTQNITSFTFTLLYWNTSRPLNHITVL